MLVFKVLFEYGADISIKDADGQIPSYYITNPHYREAAERE